MRRLIYGPFQPVCFKRDLAYTLTLTRFFTGPFYHALLLKYTRFHSRAIPYTGMRQRVMPRMYMFMTLMSFRCWGCVRWSWSRRCELNSTYMNYMHFMLWRPDSCCLMHLRVLVMCWEMCVCETFQIDSRYLMHLCLWHAEMHVSARHFTWLYESLDVCDME